MNKSVLDIASGAHLSLIEKYEKEHHSKIRDDDMTKFIINLSKSYVEHSKLKYSQTVNLNDVRYQAAYLFQYFSALCYSVEFGIRQLDPRFGWVMLKIADNKKKTINVCSIGGGPGTDVLGLHIYMEEFQHRNGIYEDVFLNATVIDKHKKWESSWDAVRQELEPIDSQQICINYIGHDISHPATKEVLSSVVNADVILLFKFVSAVKGLPNFKYRLKEVLKKASVNSYLIYGDNLEGGNTEIFEDIAEDAGFQLTAVTMLEEFRFEDESDNMEELEYRYDRRYQQKLSMCFMIMKKA